MIYIITIIFVVLFIDVYIRIIQLNRLRDFTAFQADILNKILVNKQLVDKKDIDNATKDLIKTMPPENVKRLRKNLLKLGVYLNK